MKIQYAMIFVGDMKRATAFYKDVLGFPLKFESPGWTEFASEGATLALHSSDVPAQPREADIHPAGTCRFGFSVDDLDAYHRRMQEHDVSCVQEPTLQFGAKIAQYLDLDGMVFSVGEARKG